jgi:NADPH:quinone reductase-like Zn-dependent oxidoreductase
MLRSIGADHVVDHTVDDFLETAETYDVIFDVIGNRSLSGILARLLPKGRYVSAVPRVPQVLAWQWAARSRGKRVIIWVPRTAGRQAKDFAFLERLVEDGSVRAIIDRCFALERAADAQRYVAQGQKKGHVILTVDP